MPIARSISWTHDLARIDWDELAALYRAAQLGDKSAGDLKLVFINSMFRAFAFEGDVLVGAGRALADGRDCSYLCDIAVMRSHQGIRSARRSWPGSFGSRPRTGKSSSMPCWARRRFTKPSAFAGHLRRPRQELLPAKSYLNGYLERDYLSFPLTVPLCTLRLGSPACDRSPRIGWVSAAKLCIRPSSNPPNILTGRVFIHIWTNSIAAQNALPPQHRELLFRF
jgi:hypothetical protein